MYIYVYTFFFFNTKWTNHQEIIHQMKFVEFYSNIFGTTQFDVTTFKNLRADFHPHLHGEHKNVQLDVFYLLFCSIFFFLSPSYSSHFLLTFTCKRDYEKQKNVQAHFFFLLVVPALGLFKALRRIDSNKKKQILWKSFTQATKKRNVYCSAFLQKKKKKNRLTTENGWTKEFPSFYFIVFTRI